MALLFQTSSISPIPKLRNSRRSRMRRLPDLALLVMLIAPAARADIVMTSNTTYFGHVLSRGASVTLAEGCDLSRKRTFPAKDVRAIVIDPAHCLPYQTQLPSAGPRGTWHRRRHLRLRGEALGGGLGT